jgi:CRP/FNR family cyclic AMP-dependent transcriptional regulator
MTDIKDIIKSNSLFSLLTAEELDRIAKLIFIRFYRAGRTLFFEGTPGEVMYLIHSGKVGIYKTGRDRDEFLLATIGPGSYFGEMSLLDSQPRSATARILEDGELVVITKKAFDQMLVTDPGITSKLLITLVKVALQRLRTTDEKFGDK